MRLEAEMAWRAYKNVTVIHYYLTSIFIDLPSASYYEQIIYLQTYPLKQLNYLQKYECSYVFY